MGKVEDLFMFTVISFTVDYTSNPFSFWVDGLSLLDTLLKILMLWGKLAISFPFYHSYVYLA